MNTKKKNTSPTITADKTEPAVRVTEMAMSEERIVPKIPKNSPPLLHFIHDFIFEPHFDTADAMITVNKNTEEMMSAASAAVNGAVSISLTKSSTPTAAATIPPIMPISTIIPDIHSGHWLFSSLGHLS